MSSSARFKHPFVPIIAFFRYEFIGLISVFNGFGAFIMYLCLGSYYFLTYGIIRPIQTVYNAITDVLFLIFHPNRKRTKALKIDVNYDEKGNQKTRTNASSGEILNIDATKDAKSKDIYAQMKANKEKVYSTKKEVKINEKQKAKLDLERDVLLKMINEGNEKRFEKPQTFRYKALSPEGKVVTQTFVGVSKLDIYTFLTGEGYKVFSIETSDYINFVYGESSAFGTKFSTKDLIFFITQLATYIKAGITLTEAMRILSKQLNKNKNQQRIMQSIVYYLTMGESFSSSLEHQTNAFPQLVINMIKAAEAAGNLDETLDDLGNYYTEINATHKQMISALTYPALVGIFSLVVIAVIMIKIVPQFVGIYEDAGAELNPLTLFVISFSTFLQKYIFLILILIGLAVFIIILAYKNVPTFRRSMQVFAMHLPVIGNIIIYNELTIFTKTFASLLKNDVFITDSIDILRKLTNNEIYKEIMVNTITNIAKGEKISESFRDHWAIPDIAYYMIVTGENTGQLASMMAKVSDYYQEQHRTMVTALKALIEPVMIVFLAVVVGGVMIAVIIPMFNLYSSIS